MRYTFDLLRKLIIPFNKSKKLDEIEKVSLDIPKGQFAFTERVEFKLSAAKYFLNELLEIKKIENHIKGPSHTLAEICLESFLFHIVGAFDVFLQEINSSYKCSLPMKDVNLEELNKLLPSNELLGRVNRLVSDCSSWLWNLKNYRNHCSHRSVIGKAIITVVGTEKQLKIYLHLDPEDPSKGHHEQEVHEYCEERFRDMKNFLEECYKELP